MLTSASILIGVFGVLTLVVPVAAQETPESAPSLDDALGKIQARYLDERREGVAMVAALDEAAQKTAVPKLLALFDADNWQTQVHAAKALGKVGDEAKGTVPDLIDRMKNALTSNDVSLYRLLSDTVVVLQGYEPKRGRRNRNKSGGLYSLFTMMRSAMEENKPELYDTLASTLTASGKEAVPTLLKLVKESEGPLRDQALAALAGLGEDGAAAVDDLMTVADGADADLRRTIQLTLKAIKVDNQPPTVQPITAKCIEGRSCELSFIITDSDDTVDVLEVEIADKPTHGSIKRSSTTSFVYDSKPGFAGDDTFTVVGKDSAGKSDPVQATITVGPDTEGPQVVRVSGAGKGKIQIRFNEPITAASAGQVANYAFEGDVAVSAAKVSEDGMAAILTCSSLTDGSSYTVSVNNIADRSEANNTASDSASFTYHLSQPGLFYHYYETGDRDKLQNPGDLSPTATGVAETMTNDLAKRRDDYAFIFEGMIKVAQDGDYTFYTASDDGSHLWINGKKVVENGGWHGVEEKSGTLPLTAGRHQIKVLFFQGSGGADLTVRWQGPGVEKQEIPGTVLVHTPR